MLSNSLHSTSQHNLLSNNHQQANSLLFQSTSFDMNEFPMICDLIKEIQLLSPVIKASNAYGNGLRSSTPGYDIYAIEEEAQEDEIIENESLPKVDRGK